MNASLSACPDAAQRHALRALQLPGIEQLPAYAVAYAWSTLRAWRPPVPELQPGGGYACAFTLTPSLHRRWHGFFRTETSRAIPYLYAQGAATLLQRRLLSDLGLPPGRVRHLRQLTQHVRGTAPHALAERQRLDCRLQRINRIATGVLLVVTETQLADADGQWLATVEDHFTVAGVDCAAWPALAHDRAAAADFAGLRARDAALPRQDANIGEWVIGDDWGRRYATLSGELHPVHLGRWGARLLGRRQTTLQATALRNLVARQLADVGLLPERLDVTFCRPVALGRRVSIVQRDGQFEVVDALGLLAAYGNC